METKKTLYISDLDGTLLNKSAKLSEYTTNSINLLVNNGMNFSVATARLLDPVLKMLSNLKLNIPIILMNGVLIYDVLKETYVKVNKIPSESVSIIINAMEKFHIMGFMYELREKNFNTYHQSFSEEPLDDYIMGRIDRYNSIMPTNGLKSISEENIIFFTMIDTLERLQPIYDYLKQQPNLNQTLYKNVYTPNYWFLEVSSKESSKQNAINYLRENYKFDHIVGFGDNHNDLSMFAACDTCVAVENATPDVKSAAQFICDTNENDGVAKWLEKTINNSL